MCHKKAPVGTLGYRYNKAGRPSGYFDGSSVCTLMYVWSECKLLKKVEAGELVINPTKPHCNPAFDRYNMETWDPDKWVPVELD